MFLLNSACAINMGAAIVIVNHLREVATLLHEILSNYVTPLSHATTTKSLQVRQIWIKDGSMKLCYTLLKKRQYPSEEVLPLAW